MTSSMCAIQVAILDVMKECLEELRRGNKWVCEIASDSLPALVCIFGIKESIYSSYNAILLQNIAYNNVMV